MSAAIGPDQVRHIAHLARLSLSPEEERMFTGQLARILEYADKLKGLDVSGVAPTSHVLPTANVLRSDTIAPCLTQEEALANAPSRSQGHVRVPPIIQESS